MPKPSLRESTVAAPERAVDERQWLVDYVGAWRRGRRSAGACRAQAVEPAALVAASPRA